MITTLLGVLLFAAATSSASASQFLKRAAGQTAARVGQSSGGGLLLRAASASVPSAAARTLRTLDTNHDGLVEPSEVSAFAQLQGLDVATTTKEYAGVDLNGDGNLDANELALALSSSMASTETEAAPRAQPEQAAPITQPQRVPPQPEAPVQQQAGTGQVLPLPAESPTYTASTGAAKASSLQAAAAAFTSSASAAPVALAPQPAAALEATQESSAASSRRAAAAEEMVEQIAIEEKRSKEADTLEHNATEVRNSASMLAREYAGRAAMESAKAASAKAKEILGKIAKLEDKARSAEVDAARLRASMKADLYQANEQMGVATAASSPSLTASASSSEHAVA